MSRLADPRVVEIFDVFDVATLPRSPGEYQFHEGNELEDVEGFMEKVLGFVWTGWSVGRYRAMLLAFVEHAIDEDLDLALGSARKWLSWREDFRLMGEYETTIGGSCYSDEFLAWAETRSAELREASR